MRLTLEEVYEKYRKNIYNASFSITGNAQDAEDVLSETLIRYLHTDRQFESSEHLKAWLLRTAMNRAKDMNRSFWRKKRVSFEDYMNEIPISSEENKELLSAVIRLPVRLKEVVHLYYYEGYSQKEISGLLKIPEGTVKSRLSSARKELKKQLKEEWEDE